MTQDICSRYALAQRFGLRQELRPPALGDLALAIKAKYGTETGERVIARLKS